MQKMLKAYTGYVLPKGKGKNKRIHGGRTYHDAIIRTAVEGHYRYEYWNVHDGKCQRSLPVCQVTTRNTLHVDIMCKTNMTKKRRLMSAHERTTVVSSRAIAKQVETPRSIWHSLDIFRRKKKSHQNQNRRNGR